MKNDHYLSIISLMKENISALIIHLIDENPLNDYFANMKYNPLVDNSMFESFDCNNSTQYYSSDDLINVQLFQKQFNMI